MGVWVCVPKLVKQHMLQVWGGWELAACVGAPTWVCVCVPNLVKQRMLQEGGGWELSDTCAAHHDVGWMADVFLSMQAEALRLSLCLSLCLSLSMSSSLSLCLLLLLPAGCQG